VEFHTVAKTNYLAELSQEIDMKPRTLIWQIEPERARAQFSRKLGLSLLIVGLLSGCFLLMLAKDFAIALVSCSGAAFPLIILGLRICLQKHTALGKVWADETGLTLKRVSSPRIFASRTEEMEMTPWDSIKGITTKEDDGDGIAYYSTAIEFIDSKKGTIEFPVSTREVAEKNSNQILAIKSGVR
jgi:hypothetical protein